jgi:hypothetical protein
MSKTFRYLTGNTFDTTQAKKRGSDASQRINTKRTKQRKTEDRLFKREIHFTTYIERTAQED